MNSGYQQNDLVSSSGDHECLCQVSLQSMLSWRSIWPWTNVLDWQRVMDDGYKGCMNLLVSCLSWPAPSDLSPSCLHRLSVPQHSGQLLELCDWSTIKLKFPHGRDPMTGWMTSQFQQWFCASGLVQSYYTGKHWIVDIV